MMIIIILLNNYFVNKTFFYINLVFVVVMVSLGRLRIRKKCLGIFKDYATK